MIKNVKFATIYVSDQDKAHDFYVNTLGFEVNTDVTMDGYRWLEVNPVGGETSVVISKPQPGNDQQPGGGPNIVFVADDIVTTYEELKAKGVEFVDVPEKQPWGWWGSFKDPDGNVFGLGQLGD